MMLSPTIVPAEAEGLIFIMPCADGSPGLHDIVVDYKDPKQPGWIFFNCEILKQSPIEFGFKYQWRLRVVPGVM
jgi:hypothetical protein